MFKDAELPVYKVKFVGKFSLTGFRFRHRKKKEKKKKKNTITAFVS